MCRPARLDAIRRPCSAASRFVRGAEQNWKDGRKDRFDARKTATNNAKVHLKDHTKPYTRAVPYNTISPLAFPVFAELLTMSIVRLKENFKVVHSKNACHANEQSNGEQKDETKALLDRKMKTP